MNTAHRCLQCEWTCSGRKMHPAGRALPRLPSPTTWLGERNPTNRATNSRIRSKHGGGRRASHLQLGVAFALGVSEGKDPTHVWARALVLCCCAVLFCFCDFLVWPPLLLLRLLLSSPRALKIKTAWSISDFEAQILRHAHVIVR